MSLSPTRRRSAIDPPAVAAHEIARSLAVDAVDAALRQVGVRGRLVGREAVEILHDLRAQLDALALDPTVTTAIQGALAGIGTDTLVDAHPVVDALLDLRIAMLGGR